MNSRFPKGYKPWSGEFCNFKQKVDSYRESATPQYEKASLEGAPVYQVKDRMAKLAWQDYLAVGKEILP